MSTGQGFEGYNMYAYCGNNPVMFSDESGMFWEEFIEGIEKAFEEFAPAYGGCVAVAASDLVLPFGDVIAAIAATCLTVGVIGTAGYMATTANDSKVKVEANTEAKDITLTQPQHDQNFFPQNPYDFGPIGLIRQEYSGTFNGAIIKWYDTNGHAIFEWNEDIANGEHYHVMHISWDGKHVGESNHYKPGSPIPEPWNSLYFN